MKESCLVEKIKRIQEKVLGSQRVERNRGTEQDKLVPKSQQGSKESLAERFAKQARIYREKNQRKNMSEMGADKITK